MHDNVVVALLSQYSRLAAEYPCRCPEADFYARHASSLPRWLSVMFKRMAKKRNRGR